MSEYGLVFGSLDWSPSAQSNSLVTVDVVNLERGAPSGVVEVIENLVGDGDDERITDYGNRDQSVGLRLHSTDSAALADYERTLWLEASRRRNELKWTPPDGYGAAGVYEILWAQLSLVEAQDWDLDEIRTSGPVRYFTLTLRARPFVRAVDEIVTPALVAGTATPLTISDGTSATNWTGTTAITSVSGVLTQTVTARVQQTGDYGGGAYYNSEASWTYGATLDLSGGRVYVSVDYLPIAAAYFNSVRAWADGIELSKIAEERVPSTGYQRATFLCSDTSVSALRFVTTESVRFYPNTAPMPTEATTHRIDNVTASPTPPGNSTGRQSIRLVEVGGSARTEGSLSVQHPTQALGDVLVYTCPALADGYVPSLMRWRSSTTAPTADSTTVSGGRLSAGGTVTFNVPISLLPEGPYVLMARYKATSGSAIFYPYGVTTRIGAGTFNPEGGVSGQIAGTDAFQIVTLGTLTLPTTRVPNGSAGSVEITLGLGGVSGSELDEAWLFYLGEDATLTQVSCGAGTPALGAAHNRLWLDSATLDEEASIFVGTNEDRSNAFYAGGQAAGWGVPSFRPPYTQAFVVTTEAPNPMIAFRHFPRDAFHVSSPPAA